MKKFILDQSLFLAFGIAIIVSIPFVCGSFFTLFFEVVVVLCWGYLCRRILLLPIDLIIGKVNKAAYFASQSGIEDLEFFKNMYCVIWKFNLESGQTLRLLVPIAITRKDASNLLLPQKDVIHRITYFRLSKIMIECDYG